MHRFLAPALLVGLAATALANPGPGLSSAQRKKLTNLHMRIIVPGYLPAGYRVASVEVTKGDGYTIDYKGPNGGEFIIETASEGIGDILFTVKGDTFEANGHLRTRSAFTGAIDMDLYDTKRGVHQFHTNWYDLGVKRKPRFIAISGKNTKPAEASKVFKSLRVMK